MAYAKASYAIDTVNMDLNFYVRHFYADEFLNNEYYTFGGKSYEDVYLVNAWDGSADLVLGLGGRDFKFDNSGAVTGGTVTGITEFTFDGVELWRAQGFSVSAKQVYQAALTAKNGDDRAMVSSILSGNDRVELSRYSDRFESGGGNDLVFGGGGNDRLYGEGGRDTIKAGSGADYIDGGAGDDNLLGQGGNDTLLGGAGSDKLSGLAGRDVLNGGGLADWIDGGKGNDTLTGGRGGDTFVFNKSSGTDTINDFRGGDIIQISNGANSMRDLDFTDTKAGLLVEFGAVDIFLKGLDRADVNSSDFDFG